MIPTNKKIAVLHPYIYKVWWAVKMMIYMSEFLQKNNSVIFHTLSYNETVFSQEKINFQVKSYFSNNVLKFFSFICIAFNIRKNDFIIVWNSPMHFVWVLSKILFRSKAKIIWWNHHCPWYYSINANLFIRLKRYIEKRLVKRIDRVLSNSKYLKWVIDNTWNIDSKILYPVLDDRFLNYKYGEMTKDNIILSYGRREAGKNLEMIFNTYDDLKNKISDLILIVWWEWSELQKFIPKYKNDRNVKFLWNLNINQVLENLSTSTLFLFPSKIDSFWLVQLESMSAWNPVICFKKKSEEEIVTNGVNGFCVESENDFIQKTHEVLINPTLRKTLSLWSLETSKRFTSKTFEKQLENIFGF